MDQIQLGQTACITISGETGTVTGVANYTNSPAHYRLFYKAADGRAIEGWFTADQLTVVAP